MPDECRPPPNTAPGTVCVLERLPDWPGADLNIQQMTWTGSAWLSEVWQHETPERVYHWGWRFVRIAEAPDA